MLHSAGALQAEALQSVSHTRTFQKQRARAASSLPAYSTWADWSEGTLPLSQRSPWSLVNNSGDLAAST